MFQFMDLVFLRLPLLSLVTCRMVCREWKEQLYDYSFLKLYDKVNLEQRWLWAVDENNTVWLYDKQRGKWIRLPPMPEKLCKLQESVRGRHYLEEDKNPFSGDGSEGLLCLKEFGLSDQLQSRWSYVYNPLTQAMTKVKWPGSFKGTYYKAYHVKSPTDGSLSLVATGGQKVLVFNYTSQRWREAKYDLHWNSMIQKSICRGSTLYGINLKGEVLKCDNVIEKPDEWSEPPEINFPVLIILNQMISLEGDVFAGILMPSDQKHFLVVGGSGHNNDCIEIPFISTSGKIMTWISSDGSNKIWIFAQDAVEAGLNQDTHEEELVPQHAYMWLEYNLMAESWTTLADRPFSTSRIKGTFYSRLSFTNLYQVPGEFKDSSYDEASDEDYEPSENEGSAENEGYSDMVEDEESSDSDMVDDEECNNSDSDMVEE